jgi:anti-sigma factor RsiW
MTEGSDRSDEVRRASQDEDVGGEQAPAASGELKGQTRSDDEVAAAEAEVEQSRAELTETVEALKEKLEPQNLEEQAKARAMEVARARGQQILKAVRRDPKPVAVAGGVLFLLLVRRLRRGGTR